MARDEEGKVIFDEEEQKELDRIVSERLSRVKKELPEDYEDLKSIADELGELGYSGTVAEKKAALKAYRDGLASQNELEELEEQAEIQGTSPELLREIREARKEAKEAKEAFESLKAEKKEKQAKEEAATKEAERIQNEIKSFEESYPDVDLDSLNNDPKFLKFVSNHTGSLGAIYEQYIDLMGDVETETVRKVKSSENRSTGGGGTGKAGSAGLSKEQQTDLAEWNERYPHLKMTPQEFKNK